LSEEKEKPPERSGGFFNDLVTLVNETVIKRHEALFRNCGIFG
jgi:hypothetical protein